MFARISKVPFIGVFLIIALPSLQAGAAWKRGISDDEEFSKVLGRRLRVHHFEKLNSSLANNLTHRQEEREDVGIEETLLQEWHSQQEDTGSSWESDVGFWNVTNHSRRRTCILFQAAIQFDINYYQTDGKRYIARIDLPRKSTNATGDCEERSQFITLTWPIILSNSSVVHGSVWIFFVNYYQSVSSQTRASTSNTYAVSHIRITYPAAYLPDPRDPDEMLLVENRSLDNFSAPLENSFRCEFQELKSTDFTIRFADFQYQAFMRMIPDIAKFHKPIFCTPGDGEQSSSASILTKDIIIGLSVAFGLMCIFGFIYWNKRRRRDDDDDDEYDD